LIINKTMNIEKVMEDFDEKFPTIKTKDGDSKYWDVLRDIENNPIYGDDNETYKVSDERFFPEEIKDFIKQNLEQQKEHYEKELKIADDRWKANEQCRVDYSDLMAGYESEVAIELAKQKKKIEEKYKNHLS